MLIVLVDAAGALLSKDQLLQQAWPGIVVEEADVHVQVSHLRKLLGARAIATVAPLGYRFTMPIDSAAPRTPPHHHLPAQYTRFVGREAALDDAAARLAATRLLAFNGIGGSGGSGKTWLALQLPARKLHRQADRVWFLDFAPLEGAAQAALALAVAQAGDSSLPALLQARVRNQSMLVVLDNCEHLLDAAADLAQLLLSASAGMSVLAISRTALSLSGQTVMPMRPLDQPGPGCRPGRHRRRRVSAALHRPRRRGLVRCLPDRRSTRHGGRDLPPLGWHSVGHRTRCGAAAGAEPGADPGPA